jgi:phosphoenolpyruvate synthase/pyruvate phosphate dikinase
MDIPIPDFFVVSPIVFDKVVSQAIVRDVQTLFEKGKNPEESEVLNSILKTEIDEEYIEEILSAYARISGFTDAWVSVRSSLYIPANPQVSFSGVFQQS